MSVLRDFEASGRRRAPRRRRWRRLTAFVLLAALVAVGALVGIPELREGGLLSASRKGQDRPAGESQPLTPAVGPARRFQSYGATPAPAGQQVHIRFRKPPRAALLFDVRTGRVLWEHHPTRQLRIASLTKMMTALEVASNEPPDAEVRVTREALAYAGTGVGVLPKRKLVQLETMLYGLMLPSGNDAAIALAQKVAGTVRRFVRRMNRRAERMGLACTRFSSPHGFADRGNHSCARDLAVMARDVLRNDRLAKIVRTRRTIRPFPIKGRRLYLYNHNSLMRIGYPGVSGVKTGYTDKSGRCLVGTARRHGRHLGIVLLHSPDPPNQGKRLLDAGFRAMRRQG